jgi:hypothetical protein
MVMENWEEPEEDSHGCLLHTIFLFHYENEDYHENPEYFQLLPKRIWNMAPTDFEAAVALQQI